MPKFIVTKSTKVILDNIEYLLEEGDKITVDNKIVSETMAQYREIIKALNKEWASASPERREQINITLRDLLHDVRNSYGPNSDRN